MIDRAVLERLADNWRLVNEQVADAARRAGRLPDEVRIVGVTKYVDREVTEALIDAGCRELGESRPQQLWEKADALADAAVRWHLIGHLQRNKVRKTLQYPVLIHSIDSERLLRAVDQSAEEREAAVEPPVDVLLEVNISGDPSKTGMDEQQLRQLLAAVPLAHVRVLGLMAMAGQGTTSTESRKQFAALRTLRDSLSEESGVTLSELSMGMSGDFAEAVAEGSTMVRIGSRLFEGLADAPRH